MRTALIWMTAILVATLLGGCGDEDAGGGNKPSPKPGSSSKSAPKEAAPKATPFAGRDGAGVVELLPNGARDVLEQAETLEILALHPYPSDDEAGKGETFHDYKVLGRAVVPVEDRRPMIEALYKGLNENNDMAASCFNPRHGVRAVKGERTVDLVICFECLQISGYGAHPSKETSGLTSETPEPTLDAILLKLKLTKHVDKND